MRRIRIAWAFVSIFCIVLIVAGGITFAAYGDPADANQTAANNPINNSGIVNGSSSTPPDGYVPISAIPSEDQPMALMATSALSGSSKALIIEDTLPWGTAANEKALQALDIPYDVIGSSKLATADLSKYRMVIIASDQTSWTYYNLTNNKDKIASYVSNGGVLVAHACDKGWSRGIWSNSFLPMGVTKVFGYNDYISIVDSNSPIVSSITDAQLDGWSASTHGYFTNVPADAHIIMGITGNPTSYPTYIEYSYGSGTVLATMQSIEWPWTNYFSWFGDAHKSLLKNELNYAYNGINNLPDLSITSDDITFQKVA